MKCMKNIHLRYSPMASNSTYGKVPFKAFGELIDEHNSTYNRAKETTHRLASDLDIEGIVNIKNRLQEVESVPATQHYKDYPTLMTDKPKSPGFPHQHAMTVLDDHEHCHVDGTLLPKEHMHCPCPNIRHAFVSDHLIISADGGKFFGSRQLMIREAPKLGRMVEKRPSSVNFDTSINARAKSQTPASTSRRPGSSTTIPRNAKFEEHKVWEDDYSLVGPRQLVLRGCSRRAAEAFVLSLHCVSFVVPLDVLGEVYEVATALDAQGVRHRILRRCMMDIDFVPETVLTRVFDAFMDPALGPSQKGRKITGGLQLLADLPEEEVDALQGWAEIQQQGGEKVLAEVRAGLLIQRDGANARNGGGHPDALRRMIARTYKRRQEQDKARQLAAFHERQRRAGCYCDPGLEYLGPDHPTERVEMSHGRQERKEAFAQYHMTQPHREWRPAMNTKTLSKTKAAIIRGEPDFMTCTPNGPNHNLTNANTTNDFTPGTAPSSCPMWTVGKAMGGGGRYVPCGSRLKKDQARNAGDVDPNGATKFVNTMNLDEDNIILSNAQTGVVLDNRNEAMVSTSDFQASNQGFGQGGFTSRRPERFFLQSTQQVFDNHRDTMQASGIFRTTGLPQTVTPVEPSGPSFQTLERHATLSKAEQEVFKVDQHGRPRSNFGASFNTTSSPSKTRTRPGSAAGPTRPTSAANNATMSPSRFATTSNSVRDVLGPGGLQGAWDEYYQEHLKTTDGKGGYRDPATTFDTSEEDRVIRELYGGQDLRSPYGESKVSSWGKMLSASAWGGEDKPSQTASSGLGGIRSTPVMY